MPVFFKDSTRILYIHIPKTGGSAIAQFFMKSGFERVYFDGGRMAGRLNEIRHTPPQHMHAAMLETIFDLSAFDYIFTTVRDPLERLISDYFFQLTQENKPTAALNEWIYDVLDKQRVDPFYLDNHIRPQHEFIVEGCDIFKQENGFGADWVQILASKLNLGQLPSSVQSVNRNEQLERKNAQQLVDQATKALVKKFYQRDYELFCY